MNANTVMRELLHKEPFHPIRVELVKKEVLRVPHQDFASVPPASSDRYSPFFTIYDARGNPRLINPMLVCRSDRTSIKHRGNPRVVADLFLISE